MSPAGNEEPMTLKPDDPQPPANEKSAQEAADVEAATPVKLDIEHAVVADDPRKWSRTRKNFVLVTVSAASMIAGLGANIYNPGISQVESELHATSGQISWSLSVFILLQGVCPLFWSAVSEITGRKKVYLVSITICTVGCIVAGVAKSIGVLIGMRCVQAAGSAAVISIGAATLADIYEPHERGTMMGIYYCAPLLGPSLGPIIGGALTQGFNWRATFYFLAAFTGLCVVAFVFFKDTFRRERSLTYQQVLRRVRAEREAARRSETSSLSHVTVVNEKADAKGRPKVFDRWSGLRSPAKVFKANHNDKDVQSEEKDVEAQADPAYDHDGDDTADVKEIKLSLTDVNPVKPIIAVLRRLNNLVILFASGLIFGFSYSISYTCSRTLGDKYGYNALEIGLVLLSFGIGSMFGSILGGRWSDRVFRKIQEQNGGKSAPEMRLRSTFWFMPFLPPSIIAYGWVCEQHVSVGAICVFLFMAGFFSITLAYIVDANNGRSSSAVASNSAFRGGMAFIAAEVAVPMQLGLGDGGMYTLWAGFMVVSELLMVLVWWKGGAWREKEVEREKAHELKREQQARA
ncbi:hypothetical protein EIP86_010627 [Pleurotus ostreatoroseus]|nr:hypothetical protein EIP86_010627 [Pleurotus ostreatoroseus]